MMSRAPDVETLRALTEQLSEKDFRIGELEHRVKDLFNEAKELDEKLHISNQNARVLEEENSNYHIRIKNITGEDEVSAAFPKQNEALKLIKENEKLRRMVVETEANVKQTVERHRRSDENAQREVRALKSECERMRKEREREARELENTRRQCADLQKRIKEDDETFISSKELWNQERDRYQQRIDELLAYHKRPERVQTVGAVASSAEGGDEPIEQFLLRGEVAQLEQKLKDVEKIGWEKEKEWVRTEDSLRRKILELQANRGSEGRNDTALFHAMRGQVRALQEEIEALRSDKRASRTAQSLHSSVRGVQNNGFPSSLGGASEEWTARYDSLMQENDTLRERLDTAKIQILQLQDAVEERTVVCKETEAQLAAVREKSTVSSRAPLADAAPSTHSATGKFYDGRVPNLSRSAEDHRLIQGFKQRIRDLEMDLRRKDDLQDQKDTKCRARICEYQNHIEQLQRENDELRCGDDFGGTAGAEGLLRPSDGAVLLAKDKRESVDEVMRLLECAWDSDEEAKRQLRRAKYQGAAVAGQDLAKDEEMQNLRRSINDLKAELGKAAKHAEKYEDAKNMVHDLRKQNNSLCEENDRLRKKNGDLQRKRNETSFLSANIPDEVTQRAEELEAEVDQLKRKLASARRASSQQISPRSGAQSPQPRVRRRTPETIALSELSVRSNEELRRSAVPEGAHLAVTVVELSGVLRNGQPVTEPGEVIIKLKSIKEKYKTSIKELSSVIRFDETFVFYLAQPDQDVITLHVFYRPHGSSREFHIGDACFSMAALYRGIPRQRIAPVVQSPGTKDALRAAQVEVQLQTDDFGRTMIPSEISIKEETKRFSEFIKNLETNSPEKLHAADVYMASSELQ